MVYEEILCYLKYFPREKEKSGIEIYELLWEITNCVPPFCFINIAVHTPTIEWNPRIPPSKCAIETPVALLA